MALPVSRFVRKALRDAQRAKVKTIVPNPITGESVAPSLARDLDPGDMPNPLVSVPEWQRNSSGQYVGGPRGVTSPEQVNALIGQYTDRVQAAQTGGLQPGYFYNEGNRAIGDVSKDAETARNFARTNAITSSEAPVNSNVGWAIKAHEQASMGAPIHTGKYPNQMRPLLQGAVRGSSENLGEKRELYGDQIIQGGLGSGMAPNDRWELSSVFGADKKSATGPQHAFMHNLRRQAGEEYYRRTGTRLTQGEIQELNWATIKAMSEGKTVDQVGTNESIQGSLPRWMMQHTFESMPGPDSGHLQGLTDPQGYHNEVKQALIGSNSGRDRIVDAMGGSFQHPAYDAPGVYKGDIAPGTVSQSAVGITPTAPDPNFPNRKVPALDAASEARVKAQEGARALFLGQDAIASNMTRPGTGKGDAVAIQGAFNEGNAASIEEAIARQFPDSEWGRSFALSGTPEGYRVMDLGGRENFAKTVQKQLLPELENLGATRAVNEQRVLGTDGMPAFYKELDWAGDNATKDVLELIDNPNAPRLAEHADSPEMRQIAANIDDIYQRIETETPLKANPKIRLVLRTWATEGLPGVRELVKKGLAPSAVLGVLSQHSQSESPGDL